MIWRLATEASIKIYGPALETLGVGKSERVNQKTLPPQYAYLHGIAESEKPANLRVHLRGDPENLGDEAPRRFLAVLSDREPLPFRQGSGRIELAEAIARHPLTARVIANRIWNLHFGRGIVRKRAEGFDYRAPAPPRVDSGHAPQRQGSMPRQHSPSSGNAQARHSRPRQWQWKSFRGRKAR